MRRLVTVNFAPCAIFVTCLYALVRAGSFSGRSDWHAVAPAGLQTLAEALLLITACTAVLALLLHPFQIRAVRVLEGYWDRWTATAGIAGVLVEMQRRRWQALRGRAEQATRDERARRARADARRRLALQPPAEVLLPTALGNALRAGELSAGERYGLTTLSSWPRVYMQVSHRMSEVLSSARDTLDAAVNLCWSFLALTAASAVALHEEPSQWWLCGTALASAAVAYRGAVIAAQTYAGLMHVVYDLHRFDLLEAMHYRLPPDREAEEEVFVQVSDLLDGKRPPDLRYEHRGVRRAGSDAYDADGAADA
ncbi:hypothetical protein ABT040_34085 [Streptomyces sp. NPDC002688]|uniref:hypothetical protein n=1 Tax=Streptomyces sp. NPDC002688 TaxID=3154423 RepID=UPI00332D1D36